MTGCYSRFTTAQPQPEASESAPVRPFDQIPKAKGYPVIGTVLDYLTVKFKLQKVFKQRVEKYGLIYREKLFPGLPEQVIVFDPEDVKTVFRADGKWPNRPEGGEIFRKLRQESFESMGVLFGQGEQWHRNRQPMSKFIMVPRKVGEYHEDFNRITQDLMKLIEQKKDPQTQVVSDVNKLHFRWSFESVAFFALGKRLGCLESGELPPDCQKFITFVQDYFDSFLDIVLSLWKTKKFKNAVRLQEGVKEYAMKFISERMGEIREEDKKALEEDTEIPDKVDFLTYLLHSSNLTVEEITSNIVDLLMAGVETTSYTLGWVLYCLATNPEAQERLRQEVQSVVGSDSVVTPAHIDHMLYLRNTIKETQRFYPLAGLNQRKLQTDVVLSGYHVPEGWEVLMPIMVGGRIAKYFPDPDSFKPERWSKENKDTQTTQFASLPFGFGSRMCLGRRIAELELHIAVAHIMQRYRVEFPDDKPVEPMLKSVYAPDRPLNIKFKNL